MFFIKYKNLCDCTTSLFYNCSYRFCLFYIAECLVSNNVKKILFSTYLLLVTFSSLLVSLLFTHHSLLLICYSLLFTCYSLTLIRYSLVFTRYSLLFTRFPYATYFLLAATWSALITFYWYRIALFSQCFH